MNLADWAVLITALTGLAVFVTTYVRTRKSDKKTEGSAGQQALNDGFKALIDDYQERVAQVRVQYEEDLGYLRQRYERELAERDGRLDRRELELRVLEEQIRDERAEHRAEIEQLKREFAVRFMIEGNEE